MNFDRRRFTPVHEKIFWLSKSKTFLDNSKAHADCWVFRNKKRSETGHPATFPSEIVKTIFSVVKKSEDFLVCDPFLGSGTVLLNAKEQGFSGIGIEISEEFCELSKKRLKEVQRRLI